VAACGLEGLTVVGHEIRISIPPIHCTPVGGHALAANRSQLLGLCLARLIGLDLLSQLPPQLLRGCRRHGQTLVQTGADYPDSTSPLQS